MRRRAAVVLALCVAFASTSPAGADDAPGHAGHGEHRALAGDLPAGGRSLYALPGSWTAQNGRPFALASLRGSPVLLVFFYGTCDSVLCPTVVRDVQKVEALLPAVDRSRVRFVLVTIDPQIDTPERLLAYANEHGLDASRWSLLNGPPEQVRGLANVVGVKYRPTGTGQYSHTIRITVLDRDGAVVEHADGLERPLEPIAARISSLLAESVTRPRE